MIGVAVERHAPAPQADDAGHGADVEPGINQARSLFDMGLKKGAVARWIELRQRPAREAERVQPVGEAVAGAIARLFDIFDGDLTAKNAAAAAGHERSFLVGERDDVHSHTAAAVAGLCARH